MVTVLPQSRMMELAVLLLHVPLDFAAQNTVTVAILPSTVAQQPQPIQSPQTEHVTQSLTVLLVFAVPYMDTAVPLTHTAREQIALNNARQHLQGSILQLLPKLQQLPLKLQQPLLKLQLQQRQPILPPQILHVALL
eukprot:NODE_254_length_12812_cov_0.286872.p7 type:complete len:137 gc:universal NODE_254_length_12812_cov_0.286872:12440-12030(-)